MVKRVITRKIDGLVAVVPPPVRVDWDRVFQVLGTPLPADYIALIDRYGGGWFDEYLWVLEPFSSNRHYDLICKVAERAEALEMLWGEWRAPTAVPARR